MYRTIWRRSGCCIDETVPRRQCQQLVDGLGDTHRQRSPKDIHTDLIPLHITPRGHPIHPSVSHTAVSVLSSSSRACMLNPRGRSCIASAAVRSSTSDQHMVFGWIAGSNTLECNVLVPQLVIGGLNAESSTIATATTGFLLDHRHTHTALTTQLLNTAYPLRSPIPTSPSSSRSPVSSILTRGGNHPRSASLPVSARASQSTSTLWSHVRFPRATPVLTTRHIDPPVAARPRDIHRQHVGAQPSSKGG